MSSAMPIPPQTPSLPWRVTSSLIMGLTGSISRAFLYGFNNIEVVGLEKFLQTLNRRKDVNGRERGLITFSNHVSIIDDPLMWGALPCKYSFQPGNHRWSLGSYDICFTNKILSTGFTLGQVLPTHRNAYSPHGGLFQPTMTQAIRLLSSQPFSERSSNFSAHEMPSSAPSSDPFESGTLTYSTNGTDTFPAPSYYPSRRHSWVHIFPEGRVHQHPKKTLRYFKWGISRLILESDPLPEIIPIFIDGNQEVYHEAREWPRPIPRAGKDIRIAFGDAVDGDRVFGDLREKWARLVAMQKEALRKRGEVIEWEMGELTDGLKYSAEAVALRKEVARRVRVEILKVRGNLGYDDEDPKEGLVETWIEEGVTKKGSGRMDDGSWIGPT